MLKKTSVTATALIICISTITSALLPLALAYDFYYDGNLSIFDYISINTDGTVTGTDRIAVNGNLYTLTGDINNKTIVIQHNDATLDGNGHTIKGRSWQTGVFIEDGLKDITVEHLIIEGLDSGIMFNYKWNLPFRDSKIKIYNNTFLNNTGAIDLRTFATEVNIANNVFIGNYRAISNANNTVIRNNQFLRNTQCIPAGFEQVNDVDTSNTVNGKPLYYWVNQHDRTVPPDAGWVCLKNCGRITIQGLTINQSDEGITLYGTNYSTIKNNILSNNTAGISLYYSNNTLIANNQVVGSTEFGISLYQSNENTVAQKTVIQCSIGILAVGNGNSINQNQINENSRAGLLLQQDYSAENLTYHSSISQNTISRNGIGVWIDGGRGFNVILNNITDNVEWGIKLEGSQKNNMIIQNNFVSSAGNMPVCISGYWKQTSTGGVINGIRHQPAYVFVAAGANVWDNSTGGNYWIDYRARYPNASEVDNSGVGNTPYYINENNIDNHPQTQPFDITNTGSPDGFNSPIVFIILTVVVVIVAVASISLVYFKRRKGKP